MPLTCVKSSPKSQIDHTRENPFLPDRTLATKAAPTLSQTGVDWNHSSLQGVAKAARQFPANQFGQQLFSATRFRPEP
jgi:hypothetical protein